MHNVIIRNLNFRGWPDDAINVQMFSHHVWIDHNTWTTGTDGGVDIKRGSSYVTVSCNHADGTDKNMLLGHDDGNAAQDIGRLKVSYHHNWFDDTNQRNPRVRFGDQVHVYNNYYNDTGNYGVASTENAGVIVEGNYFVNVDDPFHLGEATRGRAGSWPATTASSTRAPARRAAACPPCRTRTPCCPAPRSRRRSPPRPAPAESDMRRHSMSTSARRGLVAVIAAALAAVIVAFGLAGTAQAATLFADDFNDNSADGWSKSGGDWAVVSDGTPTFTQSKTDSELAREFAGSTSWTAYSVQARVKPPGLQRQQPGRRTGRALLIGDQDVPARAGQRQPRRTAGRSTARRSR